uniref:Uncharacterized protein n=1 Tax=Arundo donax TaxID=35708 RepID=A0A0A9D6V0_ARUDO
MRPGWSKQIRHMTSIIHVHVKIYSLFGDISKI